MTIGSLGDVVFQVNNYKILSPSDFRTRREARYERHEVVGTLPSQEFLAPGPGTVNFSIKLRADLGCDPVSEAETLEAHCEQGVYSSTLHGRTLTGSGPVNWRHDNSPAGIADLVGNVWEWTGGMRLNAGEINILPDNDAAAYDADMSADSSAWKAMLQDGTLTTPGTASTLKYDAAKSGGLGAPVLNTEITNQFPDTDTSGSYSSGSFKAMTAADGVTVPALARLLSLYPVNTTDPVARSGSATRANVWRCAAALTMLPAARACLASI